MSRNQQTDRTLTRRALVQRSGTAAAALFIAACSSDVPAPAPTPSAPTATATRGTNAAQSATATRAPSATTVALPSATTAPAGAAPLPTATELVALVPTPWCDDEEEPTQADAEGPFYTPDTPQRSSFLADGPGTAMVLTGHVLTTDCQPIAGAWLDFWHASDAGEYDNVGYLFRGHLFTDENGAYRLETVVPGLYPGRTRHFHVKVRGPQTALLTTQLYFPGEAQNGTDGLYHDSLLMTMSAPDDQLHAAFDFVLT